MSERFTYPPETTQELHRQSKRRLWFWFIFLSPFWGIGLHSAFSRDGWLGPLIALGASCMAAFFESLIRRFVRRTKELVTQSLEYDGTRLRQVAPDGTVIGEIDLTTPFSVTYPYSAGGNAVYQVSQARGSATRRCVEFSSEICGGERLVREILHYNEWPPGANSV